jgi:hypothetical protein
VSSASASTLSTVVPPITECGPHELLPIMPPSVLWLWVAGSGAKVRPWRAAAARSSSSTTPGSTRAMRRTGSISRMRSRYFEKSITTATLQHCPHRLVPAPRDSSGAPWRRQMATVRITSSMLRGITTPIGTCR